MHNSKKDLKAYAFLFLIALGAYWQVSLMEYSLKWDQIDVFYPWRYFAGECLQNGFLPLWMPYQHLGYPIHADGSSGVWYPLTWLIGYFHGYDIYAIHIEFVFHIFLAGIGFYGLAKRFGFSFNVTFFCAVAYMLSGFFTGNAQHLPYIVSGAWIPFILSGYFDIYRNSNLKDVFKTAFFSFLLITGGYLSFVFVLLYLLLLIFIVFIIRLIIIKDFDKLKQFIFLNLITLISTFAFSAVILISLYQVLPFLTRAEGFLLEEAIFGPFSPQSTISFLLPFASVKDPEYLATDIAMSNAYIGLITFVFFLISIFIKKPKMLLAFFIFSIVCLAASMGGYLPVRGFLFDHLPLMNLFRFPAMFRLFFIIGFILMGGFGLQQYVKNYYSKKFPLVILILFFFVFLLFIFYSRLEGYLEMRKFITEHLWGSFEKTTRLQHIAFQSAIQLIVVAIVIIVLYKVNLKKVQLQLFSVILIAEMILAVQLNAPYTVYYEEFKPKELKEISKTFPENFPIPELKPIEKNTDQSIQKGPFWRNTNALYKTISFDGFNSFVLKDFVILRDSFPALFEATIKNPPVFIPEHLFPERLANEHAAQGLSSPDAVYVEGISAMEIKTEEGNTAVEIIEFNSQYWKIKTTNAEEDLLVLMQVYYPPWEAKVNGSPAEIKKVNFSLMGVFLPEGENIVEFSFSPFYVKTGLIITILSLLSYIVFLVYLLLKKHFLT